MKKLDVSTFQTAVRAVPLISVDLLLVRADSDVLLGLRANRPAQHCWFVPGGRIYKDERMQAALVRVAEKELGLGAVLTSGRVRSQPMGVFEQFYGDCFSGDPSITTHYVAMPHLLQVPADFALPEGDEQHAMLRWWSIEEALASADVHSYCKDYLRALPSRQGKLALPSR